jgi:flagella basal body P-ring formation protein FlgA
MPSTCSWPRSTGPNRPSPRSPAWPTWGRTLGRALQPGQGLRATDLRQRQWFAAGDTVQVLARGNGFAVSGEAQALNPGIEGQPVRVRTESGRVLTGTPVADRRVEVLL